jgi:hypothetical protein
VNRKAWSYVFLLLTTAVLLAACGTPEAGRIAAQVAEAQTVAAVLTATAAAQPQATEVAVAPSVTLIPTDQPTPTVVLPTDTPPPQATATQVEVVVPPTVSATFTPLPQPTPAPQPSPTPIVIAALPVDGGGGDVPNIRNNNPVKGGRNVTLPGFSPADVREPMVFRDRIVFQAEVFDANVGTYDGAGIDNVRFTITDDRGVQVHSRQENNAGYCVFGGGEPDCSVLVLADSGYTWPDGQRVFPGSYSVTIEITPKSGDVVNWFWSFAVDPAKDMARIDAIYEQSGAYVVDFESFGFTPQLPGQHVHFFFDTVPPVQAGVPGEGPWKLYGGSSPFTEYSVGDRPPGATQMCILVANADHSVQPDSGNCLNLP